MFYEVEIDPTASNFWYPTDPLAADGTEIDARSFTQGMPYDGRVPHHAQLGEEGRPTNFILAAFDMPIVSRSVADILQTICASEIQRFPVSVGEFASGYEILNATTNYTCVDEQKTKIMRWTAEDGRPEKTGKYKMIIDLTIDPERVIGKHLFRVTGWRIALIVSEVVKTAIEDLCRGEIVFLPVCRS